MKAAYIEKTGPAESILYGDLPMPKPTASQALVRVEAVAVNPIDTYIRGGMVQMPLPFPFIVGCDLSGVVEEVGSSVIKLKVGDRVWGTNQGLLGRQGTFAEYAAVEEHWLYPIPEGVDSKCAVATALVGITAHLGLFRDAKIRAGETLFVNGGTGGVGSTVVQMCKAIGAKVITTAGTDEKVQAARELGADHAINYRTEDVEKAIAVAAPKGINVWWETLREPNFDRIVSLLAPRGRIVIMAGRDARPPFPVGPFYVKGCSLFGFAMFNATPDEQESCSKDINRWLAEKKLKSRIDRVLPLAETAVAHKLQEQSTIGKTGAIAGKIVLTP